MSVFNTNFKIRRNELSEFLQNTCCHHLSYLRTWKTFFNSKGICFEFWNFEILNFIVVVFFWIAPPIQVFAMVAFDRNSSLYHLYLRTLKSNSLIECTIFKYFQLKVYRMFQNSPERVPINSWILFCSPFV